MATTDHLRAYQFKKGGTSPKSMAAPKKAASKATGNVGMKVPVAPKKGASAKASGMKAGAGRGMAFDHKPSKDPFARVGKRKGNG